MTGVALERVLPEQWKPPSGPPWRFTHRERPLIIEVNGYTITLLNYVTGRFVSTNKDTEFEVLQVLTKMGSLPDAVFEKEVEI